MLGGLARGSELLLVPVQWHCGEQIVEREWERLGPGQQALDRLRAEWDEPEMQVNERRGDAVRNGQLADAGCFAGSELLVPEPGAGDGFEDCLPTGVGREVAVAYD